MDSLHSGAHPSSLWTRLSCVPSSTGASALGAPVSNTSRDAASVEPEPTASQNCVPQAAPAQQPARRARAWGREGCEPGECGGGQTSPHSAPCYGHVWKSHQKACLPHALLKGLGGPRLGLIEAPGDHRPGLGSAAPAGRLAPGPSSQPAERRGWRPPTSETHSRGRGKLLSVSNRQSRCRQRARVLVPRGSVYRSVSREDTPDRKEEPGDPQRRLFGPGNAEGKCRLFTTEVTRAEKYWFSPHQPARAPTFPSAPTTLTGDAGAEAESQRESQP